MNILAVSDVELGIIYNPTIANRFKHVDVVVSAGDLPYFYLEFIVSTLDKPLYYVLGNHSNQREIGIGTERDAPQGARGPQREQRADRFPGPADRRSLGHLAELEEEHDAHRLLERVDREGAEGGDGHEEAFVERPAADDVAPGGGHDVPPRREPGGAEEDVLQPRVCRGVEAGLQDDAGRPEGEGEAGEEGVTEHGFFLPRRGVPGPRRPAAARGRPRGRRKSSGRPGGT